jgi:glycosyltransferase involved in cell wall biosynthesis
MSAAENHEVFVIIPAYNEEQVIRETVSRLMPTGYRVVVVDDCSEDGTSKALSAFPIVRIRHPINLGQGAALQTGMTYALRRNAQIVVHFDADGQHDPREIATIIAPIRRGNADVVFGSRFLRPSDLQEVPRMKRPLLRYGRFVSGLMSGVWLSDTHNGFRALSRHAVEQICLIENGFAHATEILEQVRRTRLRYVEVPTRIKYTEYSQAKGQPMSNAFNIVVDLVLRKLFS